MTPVDLYLDLLAKSLTASIDRPEPDHDNPDAAKFVVSFTMHYIRRNAVTMLPRVRLDNLRKLIEVVLAEGIPGDMIETGVWRGGASIFIRGCLEAMGASDRVTWVADSFEGLPEPDPSRTKEFDFFHSPMMQKQYSKLAAGIEEVRKNFENYGLMSENVRFLKGWFKDTLPSAPIERLSIMRLDGDYYESTRDALTALYAKLSPGGFVIIDDYGEDHWTDCRQAVEEFRTAQGISDRVTVVDSSCVFWRKSGQ